MDDTELTAMTELTWDLIPMLRSCEVRVVGIGHGWAETEIPLGPNGNHLQTMYAGGLFAGAEVLGGLIAMHSLANDEFAPVVKDLQIRFARPARTAIRARAELSAAEVDRVLADARATGKGAYTLEATLTDETGEVVATTTGSYQIRKR